MSPLDVIDRLGQTHKRCRQIQICNQYIRDNFNLHSNSNDYPTIDHKISCLYGFKNNISIDIISDISNLCITKRIINSKKSQLNEDEFKLHKNYL